MLDKDFILYISLSREPEPQIIDHVTQQKKLFPEIATSIANKLAADKVYLLYLQTSEDIKRGEFGRLSEMHALSCAMKSLSSSSAMSGIEILRLACGGHGYLSSAGLSNLYADATAACTYEGENTVLQLQVGRFLMKSYPLAMAGKPLASSIAYLQSALREKHIEKWNGSWENIVKALQITACK